MVTTVAANVEANLLDVQPGGPEVHSMMWREATTLPAKLEVVTVAPEVAPALVAGPATHLPTGLEATTNLMDAVPALTMGPTVRSATRPRVTTGAIDPLATALPTFHGTVSAGTLAVVSGSEDYRRATRFGETMAQARSPLLHVYPPDGVACGSLVARR